MGFTTEQKATVEGTTKQNKFVTDKKTWISGTKENYHKQRLDQSKWAFWLSFYGGIAGFIIIVISLMLNENEWPGVVAGGIIEAVSALFYQLSNNANKNVTEFFDKLTVDSNTTQAISLIEKISNDDTKDELVVKVALHLVGISEDKICNKVRSVCQSKSEGHENEKV